MVASVSSSQSGLLNGPKQATTSRGDKVSLATLNQLAWVIDELKNSRKLAEMANLDTGGPNFKVAKSPSESLADLTKEEDDE
jgi:hypothetical protein